MSQDLELRRKKLLFRAGHRGTKELDILFTRFAEAELATMDSALLSEFEALMLLPDPQVYDWVVGQSPWPADMNNRALEMIYNFNKKK